MHKLFYNYVVDCEMYGADDTNFKIMERNKARNMFIKDTVECNHEVLKRLDD